MFSMFKKKRLKNNEAVGDTLALPTGAKMATERELSAAVPHLHPDVKKVKDKKYGYALMWLSEPRGLKPPRGWLGRVWRGPRHRHLVVLDDAGRRAVDLIDGERNLAEIAEILAIGQTEIKTEIEKALLKFLGGLAKRNVIILLP